uniref:RRM domain-containing protein n=1 Tax=Panagrellus redivivus TaxID=6233 RepID=A0A7E4VP98_PANRE
MDDSPDLPQNPLDSGGISDEEAGANEYFAEQMDTSNQSDAVEGPADTTIETIERDQADENSQSSKHDDTASRATSVGFVEYTGEDASPASASRSKDGSNAPGNTPKTETDGAVGPPRSDKPCPAESTLWMSEIKENWDHEFLTKAFEKFKFKPKHIKIINEKTRTKMYAFIEFDTPEIAKNVLLKCSERSVPGDPERSKFHLSFANLPNQIINEYCLSVSNLSSSVTDIDLFKLFGTKYNSCRGAKVHVNPDGRSKGVGMIKFSNQTDQQLALVEMHKQTLKGKEIFLRLAPTKQRGPKNLLNTMHQQQQAAFGGVPGMYGQPPPGFGGPMYGGAVPYGGNRGFGNQFGAMGFSGYGGGSGDRNSYRGADGIFRQKSPDRTGYDRDRRRRSRSRSRERSSRSDARDRDGRGRRGRSPSNRGRRRRSRSPDRKRKYRSVDDHVDEERKKLLQPAIFFPSYVEDNEPLHAAAHNELLMDAYEDYLTSLESGKWSDFVIASNWRRDDIIKHLYSEALVAEIPDEK